MKTLEKIDNSSEADKLKEMNAQQKADYEREQLEKKVEELMKKEALSQMSRSARGMLQEKGINVSDQLLGMLISEDKIVNIIKDAMPNWVVLRNKIKPGLVNIVPLYDYLTEYYLNYSYKFNIEEDIKPFIEGLNKLFGELVEDEDFIYTSTHLEEKEEITEE